MCPYNIVVGSYYLYIMYVVNILCINLFNLFTSENKYDLYVSNGIYYSTAVLFV